MNDLKQKQLPATVNGAHNHGHIKNIQKSSKPSPGAFKKKTKASVQEDDLKKKSNSSPAWWRNMKTTATKTNGDIGLHPFET